MNANYMVALLQAIFIGLCTSFAVTAKTLEGRACGLAMAVTLFAFSVLHTLLQIEAALRGSVKGTNPQ